MTKLETLYASIKGLQDLGLPLNEETRKAVDDLEEQLIRSEILPTLSKDIEPMLSQIQRELVLVVEYKPGTPLRVALSRKAKISEIIDAKTLTPRISNPVKSREKLEVLPHTPTKHIENTTKGLRVTFPDGTVIWRQTAIETFIATLQRIGFDRISAVGIEHSGYNLVSRKQRPVVAGRVWQHKIDGWYIYSNMRNDDKATDLKLISNYYHLGLIVEEGKPE